MVSCAIHQPNFFPWAGYFDKIKKADVFIFLDAVDYPKSGSGSGSWCNRVKLMSAGASAWVGLPISKVSGPQRIKDVEFANKAFHLNKLRKTLEHNHKKLEGYDKHIQFISNLLSYNTNNLAEYNINAIMALSDFFNFKTKFVRQSELNFSLSSTELLIELCHAVNADTYICGNGCFGYQNDDLFVSNGVTLQYQNYDPLKDKLFTIQNEVEGSLSVLNHILKGVTA
jgi:uncharacterized protein YeeX (DUF496 family)